MTPGDAARILAVAAMFDRRTVGEADAIAWADALDGLDPRECAEAVRAHFAESTVWLMPAHVRSLVAAAHREAARRRKDDATLRGIEAATIEHDRERSHAAYLETRRAFDEALRAKKHADDEADEVAS